MHTDSHAAQSASAINAQAYTVGEHIVFNTGQYSPTTSLGRYLLTHELTHVLQQGMGTQQASDLTLAPTNSQAEREAETFAGKIANNTLSNETPITTPQNLGNIYRQTTGSSTAVTSPPTMTRQVFETTMQQRFGVQSIRNGTFAEQAASLTRHNLPPADDVLRPLWQPWNPGSSTTLYQNIVDAFDTFQREFGAIPPVSEIVFFNTYYERDTQTGALTPNSDIGADFGGTTMRVYRSATTNNLGLPMGRSTTTPPPNPPVAVLGGRGTTPGAPIPLPSRQESEIRTITHELGHGVAQAAHRANPNIFNEYRLAVGWTLSNPPQLFDIGVAAVQTALQNNTTPPAQYQITRDNWNNPQWIEQPITGYMVTHPAEDFADAIMTYINNRPLLQNRSPHRFQFIDTGRSQWLPFMQQQAPTQPTPTVPQPTTSTPPRRRAFRPRTDFNDRLIRDIEGL
ncbi:hypothetical protein NIES4101_36340 [Calothrix sp. NIES-4101]|nr:hypothetical protein NIES4101_36340 [Calothrix sp. NIES-4101]